MVVIKSNDSKCFDIDKEQLMKIKYFETYFSNNFNDDKKTIELDYNTNIITYFINHGFKLQFKWNYVDGKYIKNEKYILNNNEISEYISFLNYIGFDGGIKNLIYIFGTHKRFAKYLIEIYILYPQLKDLIQDELNYNKKGHRQSFNYNELFELEDSYQISKMDLHFKYRSGKKCLDDVKLIQCY